MKRQKITLMTSQGSMRKLKKLSEIDRAIILLYLEKEDL